MHIWKNFVNGGYGDKSFVHSASERQFSKPLVEYFLDIRSPSFAWMSDLTLFDTDCSSLDLKQLVVLVNLQNLQILYSRRKSKGSQAFDDGVLGFLASHAASEGTFSRLEMLFVQDARKITSNALKCLNQFPALDTFCVCGTGIKAKHMTFSVKRGWVRDLE